MISFSIYPTIVVATVRHELDDFCCLAPIRTNTAGLDMRVIF